MRKLIEVGCTGTVSVIFPRESGENMALKVEDVACVPELESNLCPLIATPQNRMHGKPKEDEPTLSLFDGRSWAI